MTVSIGEHMRQALADKEIFRQADQFAFDYAETVGDRPVFPPPQALTALQAFDEALPDATGDAATVLAKLHQFGAPATTAQTGGRYFGFVNGGALPVALAARRLSDFWDQNAALFPMSPVAAKLEETCQRWLNDLFQLPEHVVAGFVGGSSGAALCALAAARYRLLQRLGWDVNRRGLRNAPPLRIVTGDEAHATIIKAAALLGFGADAIERVKTDAQGRLIAEALPPLDERTIVILQAGNVCSGGFDPVAAVCPHARAAGAWTHIDGAFGLWAATTPELAHLTAGMAGADSWSVDGHKTLNLPYDNGVVLCADADALTAAMQASASYLGDGNERNGMALTADMSRRMRAVEWWAALAYLGKAGVAELVGGLCARARQFGDELTAAGFEVLNDIVFNQVVVACADDAATAQILRNLQESGECWAGGAHWQGRAVIRISVCSWATTATDISRSARAFIAARDRATAMERQ